LSPEEGNAAAKEEVEKTRGVKQSEAKGNARVVDDDEK
jgi:hypothetical protein